MERAAFVKNVTDVTELEKKINGGQIEEVKILEWKTWEPLVAEAPKNQWKWPI